MHKPFLAAVLLSALGPTAWAFDYTDEAEVIAATPIYETINEPTRECWNEPVPVRSKAGSRSYAGAAVGGVAGGLIGSRIGDGRGRTAATAAGAAIGALTGDRVENDGSAGRSYLGALIGGVAGGLLGAQFGDGNGRNAMAAIGAVTGALVGDRLDNAPHSAQASGEGQTQQHCRSTDNYRQVVTGYTVLYRYNGREAETVLPYKPGPTIRIGVGPADGAGRPRN